MRVLLVEDDSSTAKSIELMLKSDGYVVDTTDLGEDGLEIGKIYDYDIIILDLMLPDMDGYDVLKNFRAAKVETPILILSGLTELDNKIKGLGFGADDYLTKPFDKRELMARIQAIVRRSQGHAQSTIKTGQVTVNLDSRTVDVAGQPLHLTGLREFLGPKNIQLPVSKLAKWKTTVQMIALGFLVVGDYGNVILPNTLLYGQILISIAAALTVITGWRYLVEGLKHIK
ncbi:unnamed protein product [Cyprideis torosa]|uniref:Uncharacterized protein n=1 Tax=Cyprideis torosa TaxID=163714 RepID=A0A7R8WU14_9CRUS|nr:unnamed protein product [Cyprideis torosa]CAG0905212.1 unnamed protein product [Cyprideis torosa]